MTSFSENEHLDCAHQNAMVYIKAYEYFSNIPKYSGTTKPGLNNINAPPSACGDKHIMFIFIWWLLSFQREENTLSSTYPRETTIVTNMLAKPVFLCVGV